MLSRRKTPRERAFCRRALYEVRHITLDPKGPGVVRIHMIPPRPSLEKAPYLLLLNGAQLIPVNLSWAILLANFMDAVQPWEGREIPDDAWPAIEAKAVAETRKVYPLTPGRRMAAELHTMLDALIAIARGEEPQVPVGQLSLGEYASHMAAPHRMDLMVSAMVKDGAWHCNQKCLHCYAAGQPLSEVKELSTDQWRIVLANLHLAGIPQVTFTGGEPTLRPDLVELVNDASWFVTRLNTNGRLLTPELCRGLYDASLDSVQVTLYAADAAVHNALVGAEGFVDTVQGIRNAVHAGLVVSVNTPLCSRNTDYAATLEFIHSLGVRYATCSGLIPTGGAATDGSIATRLSPEELETVLRAGMEKARALEMEVDFTSPGWLREEVLRQLGFTLIPSCGACLSNMAVAPDGSVVPCQSWLDGTSLGNILKDDWPSIWDGADCRAIREKSAKMEQLCQLHHTDDTPDACKGGC